MSHKNRTTTTTVDFDIGISEIIPATQEAYRGESFSALIKKEEKTSVVRFEQEFLEKVGANLKDNAKFPTDCEVFVFIVQYFASENEYQRRDIDNMAKTILNVAEGHFYNDDCQVKTLLVGKKMIDRRVSQNFAYVAIKVLTVTQDVDALKISGLERAVTMFQELRSRAII